MFTDDAHLAVLEHVDVVDEATCRDPLRNQADKLRINPRHQEWMALVIYDNILVTSIVDGAIRLHHLSEASPNQFLVM